jgi:hypothetical protein
VGAAGRDVPPGPGAAPWLLLALAVAALRAPPALGLRAGEQRCRLQAGRPLGGGGVTSDPGSYSHSTDWSWGKLKSNRVLIILALKRLKNKQTNTNKTTSARDFICGLKAHRPAPWHRKGPRY